MREFLGFDAAEVCSAELERPPKPGAQVSLRMHRMLCSGCTNYRHPLKTLRQVMQAYARARRTAEIPAPMPMPDPQTAR